MLPVARVIGHREWAPGRKVDPRYDMNWRRNGVAGIRPRGGALMALTDAQQEEMYRRIIYIDTQIGGDLDAGGPEPEGWPARRHLPAGTPEPNLTVAAGVLEIDREVNSRLDLSERPGPDTDTQFGHVLSLRQEVRDLTATLTALSATLDAMAGVGEDPKPSS